MNNEIIENINSVKRRIAIAAAGCGRDPDCVKLMAVTKTVAPERILQAVDAGITLLGENYVQEAKEKIAFIKDRLVEENSTSPDACPAHAGSVFQQPQWHMIGHLQANKAKYAVNLFDCIHSVDRLELAAELNKRAGLIPRKMSILIEINVSGEKTKNGVAVAAAMDLVKKISALENLAVHGLMTMAPYSDNPESSRPYFRALRCLRNDIKRAGIAGVSMDELSMGMTDDFAVAVEEGATIIRVGRAIFGARPDKQ